MPAHTAPPDTAQHAGTRREANQLHTRENPFLAPLIERRPLTCDVSQQAHGAPRLLDRDSDVQYEAGDACGVLPQNDRGSSPRSWTHLQLQPGRPPCSSPKAGATSSGRRALSTHLQITRLTRKMIAGLCDDRPVQEALRSAHPRAADASGRVHVRPRADRSAARLPWRASRSLRTGRHAAKLAPRLYSISSSPLAHAGQVHTTVAVVRYRSHNRERGGVCSTMLAERIAVGERLPDLHPAKQAFPRSAGRRMRR